MIVIRPSGERGHADHGWLDSHHTFSFADYHDPRYMGVSCLRVLNEDRVAPSAGFPSHYHSDMEIISYVLEGALEHKDGMGNHSIIRPGEVQRMSAGHGVRHSEYNASGSESVHFLQIWIEPAVIGIDPGYEQRRFSQADRQGRLHLIASSDGTAESVTMHQDARLYTSILGDGDTVHYSLSGGRTAYLHVARGRLTLNGRPLSTGDGATIKGEAIALSEGEHAELLLFDLP